MTETILEEAARATSSDRNKVYGHPRLHFACTAAMVHAYLVRRGWTPPPGQTLLPHDWAQIIGLDKASRQAGNLCATGKLHRDTSVDQAGYARTGEMLDEQPPRTEAMCSRCVRVWEDCECHDGRPPILGQLEARIDKSVVERFIAASKAAPAWSEIVKESLLPAVPASQRPACGCDACAEWLAANKNANGE